MPEKPANKKQRSTTMSVFGSLFTAVSALSSQSQALGMISNNIANVNTVGYKRTDAAFSSLVTNQSRATLFSPGSVRAEQNARINEQGILQQSNSSTDIAVSGNGFFVVQQGTTGQQESLYTRAGSFSEDATGVLKNTGGFFLMGWPLDQDGALPPGQADISSLVPVDVAFLGGLTQPTSEVNLSLNLDASTDEGAYPVPANFSPDFTRGIRVFDSLGEGQDLSVSFVKHDSPTATSSGSNDLSAIVGDLSSNPNLAATDTFDITVGATGPTTITLNGTLGELLTDLNAITDVNGDPVLFAETNVNGELVIKARTIGDNVTLADGVGTPLADYLGNASAVPPAAPTLLATPNTVNNTEGWWNMRVTAPSGAILTEGSINFNGSGQLNSAVDANDEVLVNMANIDWQNGADLQDINLDITNFTQFAGEFNVIFSEQNGAELGLRTGISIDSDGFVTAQFSNGQSAQIYKLPLATFANANGLNELTGNVFRESDGSGNFNLREAGQGSAGQIEGGTLEGSNVDLADEFSKMIITQRAYSAGTKVISTADEMTAELLRLR